MADYNEIEQRILDMWPKFKDGCYVQLGDKVVANSGENKGREFIVRNVYFENGHGKLRSSVSDDCYWTWKAADPYVKRPAVIAADGEPLEVGQMVYVIENGKTHHVTEVDAVSKRFRSMEQVDGSHWLDPTCFTHKRPVLDADGVPLREGDTVWHHSGFAYGVVTSIDAGSLMGTVRYVNGGVEFRDAAKDLTHTRPDSWERLEEDASKETCEYFGSKHCDCSTCKRLERSVKDCGTAKSHDLVRRAKALAEKEAGQ